MTLVQAFRDQSGTCTHMGSPLMGRLLAILAENWPAQSELARKMAAYEGDIGPAGHSLPLRICGGLHALVLSGKSPELAASYPPNTVDDATLRAALLTALHDHEDFMLEWTKLPPQTNEVRRSAALIAGAHEVAHHFDLPIHLSELGASGGLNLMWDHYALQIGTTTIGPADAALTLRPDWDGPLPPATRPIVASRGGVDLNPLDPRDPDDLLRLTAYLWADQPDRLTMTRAAAQTVDYELDKGDAIDWLDARLATAPEGHVHMIQHTVAWQYFPKAAQDRGTALMEATGARATPTRPLAWLSMETDGDTTGKVGAALTLRLWPGDVRIDLGRADFHGRWITWNDRT